MLQNPTLIAQGMRGVKEEAERQHRGLIERLALINARITEDETRLSRLLDLFLDGQFERDTLIKRELELEKQIADLKHEQASLQAHLNTLIPSEAQMGSIEAICTEINVGLENATFEDKKRYLDLLDVTGAAAYEYGKEVIYTTCRLGQQQVLQTQTSPSSNTGAIATMGCACPPMARSR